MQVVKKLKDQDKRARLQFSEQFLEIFHADENILNNLEMSDEAHFHLDGYVNKPNFRYWALENPFNLHEQPIQKVTVWCAVTTSEIIGPYFFEVNNQTIAVNSDRCVNMLENFFVTEARTSTQHTVPTGWCYCTYCYSVYEYPTTSFPWKTDLMVWRHSLAYKVECSRLLLVGISQI